MTAADTTCPECGHPITAHPAPGSHLVECIECTLEEETGGRPHTGACRLRFDNGIKSIINVEPPGVWEYVVLVAVGLGALLCAARLVFGVSGGWRTVSILGLILNLIVLTFGISLLRASLPNKLYGSEDADS